MSSLANWSYNEGPVTVWPHTLDEYQQPVYGTPFLIPETDFEFGGRVARDDNGDEFVPNITVYFEGATDAAFIPQRNWYMKPGDHTAEAQPPKDAERIRMVNYWPMTKFGENELPDWKVMA